MAMGMMEQPISHENIERAVIMRVIKPTMTVNKSIVMTIVLLTCKAHKKARVLLVHMLSLKARGYKPVI